MLRQFPVGKGGDTNDHQPGAAEGFLQVGGDEAHPAETLDLSLQLHPAAGPQHGDVGRGAVP